MWQIRTNLPEDKAGKLVKRLNDRDPEVMADLYDLYGRILYAAISRMVPSPAVAESLVEETFLRAWNRADDLNSDLPAVGPWLVSIARQCISDHARSCAFFGATVSDKPHPSLKASEAMIAIGPA
jgi:DNA-directed RNA polymerase specialized sigma24 family protein